MSFSLEFLPRFRESEADGKVGVKGYVDYFQDIASGHFHLYGKGNDTLPYQYGVAWVYSKYKLKIYGKADFSENIRVTSWVSKCDPVRVWQEMEIRRGEQLLCEGRLESCLVNLKEAKLVKTPYIELPDNLVEERLTSVDRFSRRMKFSQDAQYRYTHTVRYTDLDNNRHMNNLHYVELFLNAFSPEFFDENVVTDFELQYISQAYCGDELRVFELCEGSTHTLYALNQNDELIAGCVIVIHNS
ncbi:MAG: hypothetical protein IJJ15_02415 [Ruminococcus sp.]|nr:hypothetical protein [Ruminococcus sp.]